jgi:DNA-binding transcriptional regulator YiaG
MKRYVFSLRGRRPLDKPYLFKGAGLPNVYLRSGVKIEKDPDYGKLVTIERMPELFQAIAFAIVAKHEPLTGDEMRFLRKRMELRQADLAQDLRVTEQTVANYEKDKTEAGPADLALRYLYLAHVADDEDAAEELRDEARDLMLPSRRRRSAGSTAGAWQEARV